ncbi:MAG: hypothetical protein WCP98_23570 [Actinomycetes bacterium]|jgi:hypothetical protein
MELERIAEDELLGDGLQGHVGEERHQPDRERHRRAQDDGAPGDAEMTGSPAHYLPPVLLDPPALIVVAEPTGA